ncbi:hypothetical protein C1H46_001701 [Malus baccata]|uniref:Uncharacterized protein n=1 Tax=Malus baccata TaxID=106549 RepID=A0A540NNT9_MALBA|nr:hypothetical protein C1H46_001701 [Malus baccata]
MDGAMHSGGVGGGGGGPAPAINVSGNQQGGIKGNNIAGTQGNVSNFGNNSECPSSEGYEQKKSGGGGGGGGGGGTTPGINISGNQLGGIKGNNLAVKQGDVSNFGNN